MSHASGRLPSPRSSRDVFRADREVPMTKARINGIDIDYQEYGEGEVIVFAHGAGGNLLSWWQQIPFFSQSYRCVTFSHRGFGHSLDASGGPGADAFVDDLEGLLDHLEVESAHLVAQSMGGRTMLGFALTHAQRARSLVMADTFGTIAEPELLELAASWREANPTSGELALRAYAPSFRDREPDLASLYVQISRTNPPASGAQRWAAGRPHGRGAGGHEGAYAVHRWRRGPHRPAARDRGGCCIRPRFQGEPDPRGRPLGLLREA